MGGGWSKAHMAPAINDSLSETAKDDFSASSERMIPK
jgi:hypothetical protein